MRIKIAVHTEVEIDPESRRVQAARAERAADTYRARDAASIDRFRILFDRKFGNRRHAMFRSVAPSLNHIPIRTTPFSELIPASLQITDPQAARRDNERAAALACLERGQTTPTGATSMRVASSMNGYAVAAAAILKPVTEGPVSQSDRTVSSGPGLPGRAGERRGLRMR